MGFRACSAVRIVLLEDEESFRVGLAESLRDDGHAVEAYARPSDVSPAALDRADVVITDYRMGVGELDGLAFADAVHARHANAPVILVTAQDNQVLEAQIAARPGLLHLRLKPVDYDALHELVHEVVSGTAAT